MSFSNAFYSNKTFRIIDDNSITKWSIFVVSRDPQSARHCLAWILADYPWFRLHRHGVCCQGNHWQVHWGKSEEEWNSPRLMQTFFRNSRTKGNEYQFQVLNFKSKNCLFPRRHFHIHLLVWKQIYKFRLRFHWSFSQRVELTIFQHRNW